MLGLLQTKIKRNRDPYWDGFIALDARCEFYIRQLLLYGLQKKRMGRLQNDMTLILPILPDQYSNDDFALNTGVMYCTRKAYASDHFAQINRI